MNTISINGKAIGVKTPHYIKRDYPNGDYTLKLLSDCYLYTDDVSLVLSSGTIIFYTTNKLYLSAPGEPNARQICSMASKITAIRAMETQEKFVL
jgi:hypothetical protein